MILGVDFDNTLVCYDRAFHQAALEYHLIPPDLPPHKTAIRDFLRVQGQEKSWTWLQGYNYGKRMDLAEAFPHLEESFQTLKTHQISIFVISHKTKRPYEGPPYDLHEAASLWLKKQSFFPYIDAHYFEETLQDKLQRIEDQLCTWFVDDLPEVLSHPRFPTTVCPLLFDPLSLYPPNGAWRSLHHWSHISYLITQHDDDV
jgi:hypothetical protein